MSSQYSRKKKSNQECVWGSRRLSGMCGHTCVLYRNSSLEVHGMRRHGTSCEKPATVVFYPPDYTRMAQKTNWPQAGPCTHLQGHFLYLRDLLLRREQDVSDAPAPRPGRLRSPCWRAVEQSPFKNYFFIFFVELWKWNALNSSQKQEAGWKPVYAPRL